MKIKLCLLLLSFQLMASPNSEVMTTAADGVKVYGQKYFAALDEKAPLVLMFHQGGSNGRGEYEGLATWLNKAGFRVIAWDQRSGGDRYGFDNRTVNHLNQEDKPSYCEASADLQAALDYVTTEKLAEQVIVWGSSYSAALVFKLAADNKGKVSGVAAFSPASGGPMSACRAKMWLDQVSVPMIVFRPESEMARESSVEQRDVFIEAGVTFHIIKNGIHGSSMLVDDRTEHKMDKARATVKQWLKSLNGS